MLTHLPLFQPPMRSFHGSHARTAVTGKRGGIPHEEPGCRKTVRTFTAKNVVGNFRPL